MDKHSELTAKLDELIGPYQREELVDQIELLDGASFDFDLEKVRKALDKNHFGLKKVKERIIEQLSKLGNTPYTLNNIEINLLF